MGSESKLDSSSDDSDTDDSMQSIVEKFGTFDPPTDFDHGEEFQTEIPRPIPARLKQGSYMTRRRATTRVLFVLGIGCIIFELTPMVERLSHVILPLAFLGWFGLFLLLCSFCVALRNRFSKGNFEYVVRGTPLIGRILKTHHEVAISTEAQTFSIGVTVEYVAPNDRKPRFVTLMLSDKWPLKDVEKYSHTFKNGDYVTLVTLPESLEASLQLYGYLGLDPEREYVLKNRQPLKGLSASKAVLIAVSVLGGLGLLMSGLYTVIMAIPSGGDPWKFITAGLSGIIIALIIWWCVRLSRGSSSSTDASSNIRNPQATDGPEVQQQQIGPIIASILGLLTGEIGLCIVNQAFDNSEPRFERIEVVNYWQTTHNFVIRTYEIEYRKPGEASTTRQEVTLGDLERLEAGGVVPGGAGIAVVDNREGALGLPRVAGISPVTWVSDSLLPSPASETVTVEFENDAGLPQAIELAPAILVGEDEYVHADGELAKLARLKLNDYLPEGFTVVKQPAFQVHQKLSDSE